MGVFLIQPNGNSQYSDLEFSKSQGCQMVKQSVILGLLVTLAGCMPPYKPDQAKLAYAQTIQPVCRGERECELMWSAARLWVLDKAGYKIKILTGDYLETYSPTGGNTYIGVMLNKVPNKDGSYRLKSQIWCDNMFGCNPDIVDAIVDLNTTVNAAMK